MRPILVSILFLKFLSSTPAFAWGKYGHDMVARTAAHLTEAPALKIHAFDLGYYANVPDIVWKKPATYEIEWTNHFMDLEIFDRAFRASGVKDFEAVLRLSREEFESRYKDLPKNAGRSFWRIRELSTRLSEISNRLKSTSAEGKEELAKYQSLQEDWLVTAGVIGHYIGDLAQPFHVTENYDGQLTNQKGIHHFYEEVAVDECGPSLAGEVMALASKNWKKYHAENSKRDIYQLISDLAHLSSRDVNRLLNLDKKIGRDPKASKTYRGLLTEHLAHGALTLAEIWSRNLDWKYRGERFYNFSYEPKYIQPGSK